ncbi:MAG TPA: hypothetical protein PKA00_18840 [Saprospiraceae bacterium]|nr:hypothetical protein [Saprospiraceae bacterium]HMQ84978.1 hypothetical protein [Saprospiraceae bacterium]
MKSLLLSLLFSVLSLSSMWANNPIPDAVQKAFHQLFPAIENPFWENRQEGLVATFRDEEGFKKVFFTPEGQWQETRLRVYPAELPIGIKNFIQTHYQVADITYLGRIESAESVYYRIESELPDRIVLKKLDEQGVLLQEEVIWLSLNADQL